MTHTVTLQINSSSYPVGLDSPNSHTIREDDELSIMIAVDDPKIEASIFFEDAEPELTLISEIAGFIYRTPPRCYFAECFGQAFVRIYVEGISYAIFFNVRAKKVSVIAASKMIRYLASHHESIIRSCFSRSTNPVGSIEGAMADPESIIAAAENYTAALLVHRAELMATKRTRLVPTRQPLWKSNHTNCDIDPVDILNNLDAISPSPPEGDLFLRGRHFSLGDIDVSALKETTNVLENQILLGGLYSIRGKLQNLLDGLDQSALAQAPSDGYESFDRLLLTLTSAGMVKRCYAVINQTTELTRLFESCMRVQYEGDIRPIMTPYARTSKVYRVLFSQLAIWYELGSPSFGANHFLMKLKSLSKIYELYSLFHILEQMLASGWTGLQIKSHPDLGEYIPQEVTLRRGDVVATVSYEPIIRPLNAYTAGHFDLVDVAHRKPNAEYNYWNPDYVIRLDTAAGNTKYLIIDAKYSTESIVRSIHLPGVIDKYYWGMSVHNATKKSYSNDPIAAVLVIYPLGVNSSFIRYGKRTAVGSTQFPLPVVGATGLTIEAEHSFNKVMTDVIDAVDYALH
jgi:hypothetical protein